MMLKRFREWRRGFAQADLDSALTKLVDAGLRGAGYVTYFTPQEARAMDAWRRCELQ